jgi:hypothetical protein
MRPILFILLLINLVSCSKNDDITPDSEQNGVVIEIVSETEQGYLGRTSTLLALAITDQELATRYVTIRIIKSDTNPIGALVLSTGGFGTSFYGTGFQKNSTINFALSNGLQVLEIKWEGQFGWGTGTEGVGYTLALRGYTEIVKWLIANRIENTTTIICHGGSGGSMQIAYGLTSHHLEQYIDYGILVAGPPTSDLTRAIFGEQGDIALWTNGIGGFGITDYIMGWRGNGDYCVNRVANPPSFVIERLEEESLVNNNPNKNYSYGSVKLYFVNTDDVTNADQQGLIYYDKVLTNKNWKYLSQENSHDVGGIEAGAIEIREIINQIVN